MSEAPLHACGEEGCFVTVFTLFRSLGSFFDLDEFSAEQRLENGSDKRLNEKQLRQHGKREVKANELQPSCEQRDNVKARVVRIVEKRGDEAHRGTHNSRCRADDRGFEQHGIRFARVENPARQLERNGTAHKHLKRKCKRELHKDDRPDRQKSPEHINAPLAFYSAKHAVGVVQRHKRLSVYNVQAVKNVSVNGHNDGQKRERGPFKSILRHNYQLLK